MSPKSNKDRWFAALNAKITTLLNQLQPDVVMSTAGNAYISASNHKIIIVVPIANFKLT